MLIFSLFFGLCLGHKLGHRHARSIGHCPSEECWTYDASTGKCALKEGQTCASLTCSHDSINVEFDGALFGIDNGDTSQFVHTTTYENSKFHLKCELGNCGMTASLNDDGNLVYQMTVSSKSSEEVTLEDAGQSFSIFKGFQDVNVDLSCEYSTTVAVSSNAFEITSATADAEMHKSGDLSSGFTLNLYTDQDLDQVLNSASDTVFIGQRLWAMVDWNVPSAQKQINYYLNNCQINLAGDNAVEAKIVENNCYSSALGVSKLGSKDEWIVEQQSGFTFKSFSSDPNNASPQTVTVTCDIKLCLLSDNHCNINKIEEACPNSGNGYQYSPTGAEYEQQVSSEVHDGFKSFSCDGTHCVLVTWDNTEFTCLDRDDVVDCRGIKYAQSPSGDLRWRAPVIRNYGEEKVDATEWDNMCACHRCYSPQQEISQEDCLSVNIAVRKEALLNSEGVPIIYYYHGGGGNHGHNRYDAYELVTKENMMVISVGYRLGMFAFLYLPEIEDGQEYQSNFGIQDQIAAMKFSQKYAAIFGGNPAEAVISGSSSAGEAVWWLLTIPEAWPYFNKANIMCMGVNNANRPETASLARQVVLDTMKCETIDCLRQYTREEIRDAANIAAGTARHSSTKISLEPGFAPVVDGKFLRDHLFTLIANGEIKPGTPVSFSYNDHDQWEFNHLSIFTLKNKFLRDEIEAFDAIINEHHHSIQVPSGYSDLLLERYFGAEAAEELKTVFGCSSETVIECNVQFDRFLTSYGWNCNSRSALRHLKNNHLDANIGPIYVTQFNTRSCDPDENNQFTKTCHCTDASFMYNQNFVVPRVKGHYSANEQLYDDWRASAETQALLDQTKATWGSFFRTGKFPDSTISDMSTLDFPLVNTVDETSSPFKIEATFVEECAALDLVLGDNYLNRNWDEIGENFDFVAPEPCQNNENGYLPSDHSGTHSKTKSGKTCQAWSAQSPQTHTRTPEDYPGKGLEDGNYCRDPDDEGEGAWCYTSDPDLRWDFCACD